MRELYGAVRLLMTFFLFSLEFAHLGHLHRFSKQSQIFNASRFLSTEIVYNENLASS
jgi:hypothetical protein